MKLTTIVPHPVLAPFIHHFWVFEATVGIPTADARIVVPNGRPKLIVPWRNGLNAGNSRYGRMTKESEVVLIGVWDEPTTLTSGPAPTTTIGVEFKPFGLARFLRGDMSDLFSSIAPVESVLGKAGRDLQSRLSSAGTIPDAVNLVQDFLLERFRPENDRADLMVSAAIRLMRQRRYSLTIEEVAEQLGCSRRNLQSLFNQRIGIGPKRLQGILAFERLFRVFARDGDVARLNEDALDHFYDQPHFIRNFRQFTGYSPMKYAELRNEFGTIFYRQPGL